MNIAIDKLAELASLKDIESSWQKTLQDSLVGKFWLLVMPYKVSPIRLKIGKTLESISFVLVMGLMVALGLPQFTNDKEGLALFIVLSLLFKLVSCVISGQSLGKPSALDIPVLAFVGSNIIATFASHYLGPSIIGLSKVIVFAASYFMFASVMFRSKHRSVYLLCALLLTGIAVSLYGLYQYKIGVAPLATWEDPAVEVKGTRIFSTLGNPNLLAAYLIPMIPLSFALSMVAWSKKKYWWTFLGFLASIIFSTSVLFTGSRGGYLGLFATIGIFGLISAMGICKKYPKVALWSPIVLLVLAGLVWILVHWVPSFEQRFLSIFAGREHTSNSFRLNVWHACWHMFRDNWWFGIGPGNKTFVLAYGLYMRSGFDALGTYCVPLEIAVETGILGLTSFSLLLITAFSQAHLVFWKATNEFDHWISLGCMTGIIGLMTQGLVDTVFYRPQVHLIFWFMIALVATMHNHQQATTTNE